MTPERTRNLIQVFLGRPTRRALVLWAVLAPVCIYLGTWVGSVAFHVRFQRLFEGDALAQERSIVHRAPAISTAEAGASWERRALGGLLVPIPPGELRAFEPQAVDAGCSNPGGGGAGDRRRGWRAKAVFPEGEVRYIVHPPGFILGLQAEALAAIGGVPGESAGSEAALLAEIFRTVPADYRFRWDEASRLAYAARILSKMRLARDEPVRRVELCERDGASSAAILIEYESGRITVLAAGEGGFLVALVPETAPAAWKAAASWLPGAPPAAR